MIAFRLFYFGPYGTQPKPVFAVGFCRDTYQPV